MDWAVAATAFALIAPVELPDKTFIATVVLATTFRPLHAWLGVAGAFAVQCVVAVTLGGLLSRLPSRPVTAAAAVLFAVGAVVLFRGARRAAEEEADAEREFSAKLDAAVEQPGGTGGGSAVRAIGTSFLVLFLAEWGDLSQVLGAGLAAQTGEPVSVFAGAWLALLTVSGAAALVGKALLNRVSPALLHRIGGTVCLLLAVVSGLSAAGVASPL